MEPESKVAPEAISAPVPDDLKALYQFACEQTGGGPWATKDRVKSLIERIASLTAQVATLESERDFAVRSSWRTP